MRKTIMAIVAGLFFATTSVNAEQYNDAPKSEISVSYGGAPAAYWLTSFGEALGSAIAIGIVSPFGADTHIDSKECFGVINVDYNYHVKPWLAVGANLSYSAATGDITGKVSGTDERCKTGDAKDHYYTVMPSVKFDWFRRKHVSMYSRLAVGVTVLNSTVKGMNNNTADKSNTYVYAMCQVSPFGMEFGSNTLRAFGEVGFGQAGMALAGLRVRF